MKKSSKQADTLIKGSHCLQGSGKKGEDLSHLCLVKVTLWNLCRATLLVIDLA